jgi:threonine 3-dehydrogenase
MTRNMVALVKEERKPGAELRTIPVPQCGPDEVLVKIKASSICGTDLHIYNWDAWAESVALTPNVFGHEFAGIVEAVGDQVNHVKIGDFISAEGHMVCGHCRSCRTGNAHVCPNTRSFGITAPGCFAEYAVVRASNVIHNRPDLPFELACLQDPLGNAVQTVLSGPIAGKSVAIIGVGAIGLLAVSVAKACGAGTIYAIDINNYRLQMAKKMGADIIINTSSSQLVDQIRDYTNGEGVEVVLEFSGHPTAIRDSLEIAAPAARVSMLGIPTQPVTLDIARTVLFKSLHINGITGRRMYDTWYQLKGLLDNNRIDLNPIVTHQFHLDQYVEAFELMKSGQCGKVIFKSEMD